MCHLHILYFSWGCGCRVQSYFSLRMDGCGDIVVAICDWNILFLTVYFKKRERKKVGKHTKNTSRRLKIKIEAQKKKCSVHFIYMTVMKAIGKMRKGNPEKRQDQLKMKREVESSRFGWPQCGQNRSRVLNPQMLEYWPGDSSRGVTCLCQNVHPPRVPKREKVVTTITHSVDWTLEFSSPAFFWT